MTDSLTNMQFLDRVSPAITALWAVGSLTNVAAAVAASRRPGRRREAGLWGVMAVLMAASAAFALTGRPLGLPLAIRHALDAALSPLTLTFAWLAMLAAVYCGRHVATRSLGYWTAYNVSWLWLGLSLADRHFATTVLHPDRLPIVAMLYILAVCMIVALKQGVKNDERLARGDQPEEAEEARTRFSAWPDLVSIELVAIVATAGLLLLWSMLVAAPLDEPANPRVTPNPSMAPWYFVGFQELLVYFDPTVAGVVLPLVILFGLAAIPYLDTNHKASGYYTLAERPIATPLFLFGFLQLWVLLIVIGVFFRGPNWDFYGLYEDRETHAVMAPETVTLAAMLGTRSPTHASIPTDRLAVNRSIPRALVRELPGIVLLAGYFVALPWWLGRGPMSRLRTRLGASRYRILTALALAMGLVPIKMILHWTLHLSYFVSLPEISLRI